VKFAETALAGAYVVELERREDDRGFFARSFCRREFEAAGLEPVVAQCNVSWNRRAGTLRGMHFQAPPSAEAKLVRCTRGAIHDVIVDLRRESPTYLRHFATELTADNRRQLYIPALFAHGFLTLTDDVEVSYQMSEFFTPGSGRGIRYDDPALGIRWPRAIAVISEQDASWPALTPGGALP
jgi:dTDP-4-dehydrorhamnose 3,5-epimerase